MFNALIAAGALVAGTRDLQNAVANGETRTLQIYHTHTKESAAITFRRNGFYDRDALKQLNWILRDWRRDEPTQMDPKLFDIVWEVQREVGSREAIHVVSAYRAPETNAMLRRRSRAVAKHSQHMLGKAMDFYLPDVGMDKVRAIAMRLQRGGVGYYPTSFNPFVHLDAGSVRSWPRMTRDQLARLFPDGKTVHLPADGRPLEGYDVAAAEIIARGGSVAGYASAYADAGEAAQPTRRKSLWAALFGGGDEEDEDQDYSRPARGGRQVAAAAPPNSQPAGSRPDDSAWSFFRNDSARGRPAVPQQPAVVAALPRQETIAAAPPEAPQPKAPAAAEPVAADVPLPAARPAGLATDAPTVLAAAQAPATGPRFVWQQGPTGQGGNGPIDPATATVAALAPLPPRRPDDVAPVAATLADVPLPPARPVALAALGAPPAAVAVPAGEQNALAALAASTSGGDRALGSAVPVVAALAYAPANHPAPPTRPVVLAARAPAPAALPADPEVTGQVHPSERSALKALFAAAVTEATPSPRVRVAAARIRPQSVEVPGVTEAPTRTITASFTKGPAVELATNRFTGPAVKPLATTTFAAAKR
ncbi:DUF882 domain-containing protein [Chelatococcus sp. SYSU_G07232]|uniref:Murein endopeptidase K n=1 Tax=Chelatococcus albus TaxID=3047466 RepID=A0ABT7AG04_9HYPH|nr:DUF882 domain-containing protein [Chelatococcus sp. SYSU_G07232]MDJ1158294.1 DUF882 domain-containing protein [Chelatococcus sp. SYSU_G07232]